MKMDNFYFVYRMVSGLNRYFDGTRWQFSLGQAAFYSVKDEALSVAHCVCGHVGYVGIVQYHQVRLKGNAIPRGQR